MEGQVLVPDTPLMDQTVEAPDDSGPSVEVDMDSLLEALETQKKIIARQTAIIEGLKRTPVSSFSAIPGKERLQIFALAVILSLSIAGIAYEGFWIPQIRSQYSAEVR